MATFFIVAGILALIAGIGYTVWKVEQNRTETLRTVCTTMGFT